MYVNCPIGTKFQEIIWVLVVIVFTKHELSSIKITLGIRILSTFCMIYLVALIVSEI